MHEVFRCADAHQVAWLVLRQLWRGVRQNARHVFLRLTHRQAANGEAVKVDRREASQRFVAQVFVHAALNDAKQGIGVAQTVVLVARTLGPAQRTAHRFGRFVVSGGEGRAFVENHYDV